MGDERIRRITTILLRDADDHGRQAVGASRDHHDYVRTALYDVVDTIATLTRERDEARARGIAEERARVVAMLLGAAEQIHEASVKAGIPTESVRAFAHVVADVIKRGDHDAEGGK